MLATPVPYPRTWLRRRAKVQAEIQQMLASLRGQVEVGLHLGAGGVRIGDLINCDQFDDRADRQVDATDLRDFASGSVDWIETHHMIEHLSFTEVERALGEWSRVLKPGGFLVLTCPDITRVCAEWLKNTLMDRMGNRQAELDYVLQMMVGSQEHAGMFHKSHYDAGRMRRLLPRHGFEVEFSYSPFPARLTPSLLTIARKLKHQRPAPEATEISSSIAAPRPPVITDRLAR